MLRLIFDLYWLGLPVGVDDFHTVLVTGTVFSVRDITPFASVKMLITHLRYNGTWTNL